jgi:HAMP domain-containing protein
VTATLAPTVDSVLRRADGRWASRTGDEPAPPEYLAALATALRPLLEQSGAPGTDVEELARLRSEFDARGRIIAQRDKTIEDLTEKLAKARLAGTAGVERVTRERDEARQQLADARAQLADGAPAAEVERLAAEIAELKQQLAAEGERLAAVTRDLAMANATLDEIADEESSRPAAAPHRHQYEVDLKTGERKPCECEQPWIRDLVEDDEPVEPDVEPLTELLNRIRVEAAEAGWTS